MKSRATGIVALLIILTNLVGQEPGRFDQRCLWVVRNALVSEPSIDRVVDYAVLNRFNHLFVQVRGRGDAFYRSELVPRSRLLKDDQFDPLATMIAKAHARGIQVHAWVNVYLLWSDDEAPLSEKHLLRRHPEWVDRDQSPAALKDITVRQGKYRIDGEGIYLAPHHPEVTPHLLAVFRELAENYSIDGLHLDYVRYKDADYGNNPAALARYKAQGGDDPPVFLSTQWAVDPEDPQVNLSLGKWSDYRRAAVTDLVKKTKAMLAEVRPGCILSAAVKPNLIEARNRYFQEWDVWLAAGYLDWAVLMNYSPSLRTFAANIDLIYDNLPQKYRDRIIMGIATYNQSALDAADKIKYSRITHFRGISLFSYNVLQTNPRYIDALNKVLYP
jgi:uncharacterized lipoprotein YddW (UPF0748 family)